MSRNLLVCQIIIFKYEKKIKALLKNINCFEDKMKIEVNDQDYDALSKIESFFDTQDKSIFVSNKDLSRGDIILNCDGMHYSEKVIRLSKLKTPDMFNEF